MSVCRDCAYWAYNFPHKAGVCTVGPREMLGRREPLTVELVGDSLFHEYEECSTATFGETTCLMWVSSEEVADIPYIDADGESFSFEEEE